MIATLMASLVIWWWEPTYTSPIVVVDTVVENVRPDRVDLWRQTRDQALANWGVEFSVVEGGAIPGAINLERTWDISQGAWVENHGLAAVRLFPLWWKYHNIPMLQRLVGHEIGHALGFGHFPGGIMGGKLHPSSAEITAVQDRYGVAA